MIYIFVYQSLIDICFLDLPTCRIVETEDRAVDRFPGIFLGGGLGGCTRSGGAGVLRQAQCRGAGDTGEDDGRGHQGFAQGLEGHVWIPIKKTAL